MGNRQTQLSGTIDYVEASFGPFRLIPARRAVLCDDKALRLGEPAFKVLMALVEHAGKVVDRETLTILAWGSTYIEESNLRTAISVLRRAFFEAGCARSYVDTVAGRGYRFAEPVTFRDSTTVRRQLPSQRSRIVGRETFISELVDDISRRRFITIVGPGGVGKTTAAVGAAARAVNEGRVDSVSFVGLEDLEDPGRLLGAFRDGLGMSGGNSESLTDIEAFVESRRMLIVLDNCERLINPVAALVERVLSFAPNVVFLTTSRQPLRAEEEWVRRLQPLETPPALATLDSKNARAYGAVELFVDRATLTRPGFALVDATAPSIGKICRLLDGLPLAIEMAASCLDMFDVTALANVLQGHFRLQMPGRSTAPHRHTTLADALDWTFDSLSEKEQAVFRRLSVFENEFSFEMARVVAAYDDISPVEVGGLIGALAAKSLLSSDTTVKPGNLTLLDTTRAYARERLDNSGESDAITKRYVCYAVNCGICNRGQPSAAGEMQEAVGAE